jgi:hypothetical protein
MSLFVQVVNGEVAQVWDTQPPAGEAGWKSAVEVRPEITDGKQIYTGHTFDLTADPVEIVYGVEDLTVEQRKSNLISKAKTQYREIVFEQTELEMTDESGNAAIVSAAKDVKDTKLTAINACTTHNDLDALAE